MKCNYCGKELPQNADFCPECGMIISLGDSEEPAKDTSEVQIPEFTPNVFKTMDFEAEESQQAMELEADNAEETAPVVEAIPEYIPEPEVKNEQIVEDGFAPEEEVAQETVEDGFSAEGETFAPPEYEGKLVYFDEEDEADEPPMTQAQALFGEDVEAEAESAAEQAEENTIVMQLDQIKQAQQEAEKEPEVKIPVEDNSLIEALFDSSAFDSDKKDDLEDITKAHNEKIKKEKDKKKSSNKGYAMVFALVVVLVGIIFAAGEVVDNVLPKLQGETTTSDTTTTAPSTEKPAVTTTSPSTSGTTTTTNPSSTGTTNPSSTSSGASTTNPGSTTTTNPTTTAPTTTKPTTTAPTTTKPTTTQPSYTIKEPSSYYSNAVVFFPTADNISLKASPSSSSQTVDYQPWGYPLYAWAYENGYYYVESPVNDLWAWVSSSSLKEYETTTTTKPTTTAPSTTAPSTTKPSTTAPSTSDFGYTAYATSYTATITDSLNFRKGPGTQYDKIITVPYGYVVTVYGYSSTNPDWVYVEVTDSRYAPYGTAEGWINSAYIN